MFCTRCGAANDGGKFCTSCGAPLEQPEGNGSDTGRTAPRADAAPTEAMPPVGPVTGGAAPDGPVPDGSVQNGPDAGVGTVTTANRRAIIIAIVAAAAVLLGVIIGFMTYRAELWGGKALPDPASITSQVSAQRDGGKASAPTAKAVAAALEAKGLKTATTREFSGESKGAFLGYVGAKPGERVRSDTTVTLRESAGPGVPKNTVGRQAGKTVSTFKDMGVPVHYKKIIVNDTKKTPEGSVVATYPAAGQAVADDKKDDGIYVGVATKGDGVGADIIGGDKDTVRDQLKSKGYQVTLAPRFASKDRVGKITGSDPAPGSPVSSGAKITLYYGIDASGVQEAYTIHNSPETGMASNMLGMSSVAAGTWCRNDGDCITFDAKDDGDQGLDKGSIPYEKGRDGQDYGDYGDLISCDATQQPYCSNSKADFLLTQKYGAFELMPRESLSDMWCGDERVNMNGAFGGACVNGVMDPDSASTTYSGATYRMQDYFVVVPVGSDLKGLESKGFFDKDALASAKKGKAVDTDRPFLLYRDPKLYDKTSVPVTDATMYANPFVPYNGYAGSKSDIVKMKPAPSDASAYYLVEQGGDYDWSSLDAADVKGTDGGTLTGSAGAASDTSGASASKQSKATKTYGKDEIRAAVTKNDFTPIAGTYCLKSGKSCVALAKDGTMTVTKGGDDSLPSRATKLHYDDGWETYDKGGQYLGLSGPDDDYRCATPDGAKHSGSYCTSDEYYSQGGNESTILERPANPLYIFKGETLDIAGGETPFNMGEGSGSFTADKPCLYFMAYHMNTAPTADTVYWLQ